MFGPITAVAIDDEPSHLLAITAGLSASGIACMGYWYDRNTQRLSPEPVRGGLQFVRLVFMDLNLAELGGGNPDAANLAGTVMEVLKQILAQDAGPYLLIFWTQVSGKTDEVRDIVYQRLTEIPTPLEVLAIPKGQFLVSPPKGKDFSDSLKEFYSALDNIIPDLSKEVGKAVTQNRQLRLLSHWESRASEAAAKAINEVYGCARSEASGPNTVSESIEKVLAHIARAAAGPLPAAAMPARALDAGITDILNDQFGASVDNDEYRQVVDEAISDTIKNAIDRKIDFKDRAKLAADLNTFFHLDQEVKLVKALDRGAVIAASAEVLGFAPLDVLTSEFLLPIEQFGAKKIEETKQLTAKFSEHATFVLIEVGADCDHAQSKVRTRRFLLGLEVPEQYIGLAKSNSLRNAALQLLGPWRMKGEVLYLLVSCSRFCAWQKQDAIPDTAVRYRLRASVVNKLLHHYSVWSSRPGIVEF